MSLRQGLWQRIVGACLAVLIVLALEAIIPSVANTTSQTAKAKGIKHNIRVVLCRLSR